METKELIENLLFSQQKVTAIGFGICWGMELIRIEDNEGEREMEEEQL